MAQEIDVDESVGAVIDLTVDDYQPTPVDPTLRSLKDRTPESIVYPSPSDLMPV